MDSKITIAMVGVFLSFAITTHAGSMDDFFGKLKKSVENVVDGEKPSGQGRSTPTAALGAAPPSKPAPNKITVVEMKEIQKRLKNLGYYKGTADGIYGPNTRNAINEYQDLNGFQPNGLPSRKLLGYLNKPGNVGKPTATSAGATDSQVIVESHDSSGPKNTETASHSSEIYKTLTSGCKPDVATDGTITVSIAGVGNYAVKSRKFQITNAPIPDSINGKMILAASVTKPLMEQNFSAFTEKAQSKGLSQRDMYRQRKQLNGPAGIAGRYNMYFVPEGLIKVGGCEIPDLQIWTGIYDPNNPQYTATIKQPNLGPVLIGEGFLE